MDVDTGQSNTRNENYKKNDPIPNKEVLNLVKNQNQNQFFQQIEYKGILIEMDYQYEQLPDDNNEIEQIAIEHCILLLEQWIKKKAINGVRIHEGHYKNDRFECFDDWIYPIRVIRRKATIIIYIMIQVYSSMLMFKLY